MVWEIYHSSRWIEVWKIPTISTNCLVLNESCWLIHRTSICLVIKKLPIIVEISSPKPPVTILLVIFLARVRLVIHDAFMWFIHATLVILFFLLHLHSLNIKRMKLSSLELQTFPYFWKFHAILELYLMSRPDQGIHPLLEIQNCSKWKHFEKSIFEFSY